MMQALDAQQWLGEVSADLEKVAGIFSLSQLVEAATPAGAAAPQPPPTRSVAFGADSAWRARCSIRRLAAECRWVSCLLRLLVRTRSRVGVSRKEMCSDLHTRSYLVTCTSLAWSRI